MMKLDGYVHCTKILPEFEFQGHQGQKNALNAANTPPGAYVWYAFAANSAAAADGPI